MREGESCGVNNRSGHKKTNNTDETDKFVRETDITEMGGVIHASIFRTDFWKVKSNPLINILYIRGLG